MTNCPERQPYGYRAFSDNLTACEIKEIEDNLKLTPYLEKEKVKAMAPDAPKKVKYYTLPWNKNNEPWINVMFLTKEFFIQG